VEVDQETGFHTRLQNAPGRQRILMYLFIIIE
jgi:hypothetical protein